jgi:hypothetical protein
MENVDYENNVFINCPFDVQYRPIFDAIVFAVHDAGFRVKCALEYSDSAESRFAKITQIVRDCKYGIHDISRVEFTKVGRELLPRFNMPLELGLFLGSRAFGDKNHKGKQCLILDRKAYRYRAFISDLAGQDIAHHNNNPYEAIKEVCKWLTTVSRRRNIPGGTIVVKRYKQFQKELPVFYEILNKEPEDVTFIDYSFAITDWLQINVL